MGILSNFKKIETDRINRLFEITDRFTEEEITLMLCEIFEAYQEKGMIAVMIIDRLKDKIAKLCNMPEGSTKDLARFITSFRALTDSEKRCLMVTICNDICKIGVMEESALSLFLIERLRQTPRTDGEMSVKTTTTKKENQK